jgi:PHD/YefM family antitoxin component YafN of YafNO toxin-antitoxin module
MRGEPTMITRYGHPYAVVIDIDTWRRIQADEAADYEDYAQFLREEGIAAEIDHLNRQVAAASSGE